MERAGLHAPVEQVLEVHRDVVGMDGRMDDRPLALGAVEGADQVEPEALLRVEQRDAGVRSGADPTRLGAHERRRRHDPTVDHHRVDAQVVAVDLPTPRLAVARMTEDRHEVRPFAERLVVARELGEELVEPHDRARLVVPACRERGAHDAERQVAHGLGEIFQHDTVAEVVHVDVDPGAPLGRVDREAGPLTLVGRQGLQEREGGVLDRSSVDGWCGQVAQAGLHDAVGRDAQVRPFELRRPLLDDVEDLGRGRLDVGARRHRLHRPDAEAHAMGRGRSPRACRSAC